MHHLSPLSCRYSGSKAARSFPFLQEKPHHGEMILLLSAGAMQLSIKTAARSQFSKGILIHWHSQAVNFTEYPSFWQWLKRVSETGNLIPTLTFFLQCPFIQTCLKKLRYCSCHTPSNHKSLTRQSPSSHNISHCCLSCARRGPHVKKIRPSCAWTT